MLLKKFRCNTLLTVVSLINLEGDSKVTKVERSDNK